MVKIVHLALACLAATCAAQDTGRRKLDDDDTDVIHAKKAWREAYGTDGPDTCDIFREPTCLRWHKTKGVFPDQPQWSLERCADQNPKYWVTKYCDGTEWGAPFNPEAPVGNIQPVKVGSGQIPTLPAPPPPPCDLAAWLATLDPSLGAGATTYDVCKSRCPHAKDESSSVPPFFSGVVDFYGSADPVCIISTMVHASHIRTTAYNDCVFIACPRSNTVETMEGDHLCGNQISGARATPSTRCCLHS